MPVWLGGVTGKEDGAMVPKAMIEFREADAPIREPVTKLGGQPAWIDKPYWPR